MHQIALRRHFVGPHLGEDLHERFHRMTRQLQLSNQPDAQRVLRSLLNAPPDSQTTSSISVTVSPVLQGYLFYPRSFFDVEGGGTLRFKGTFTEALQGDRPSIDPSHLKGWWATAAELPGLVSLHPASRWTILEKPDWIGPAMRVEGSSDPLLSRSLLSTEQLLDAVAAVQIAARAEQKERRGRLLVAELRRWPLGTVGGTPPQPPPENVNALSRALLAELRDELTTAANTAGGAQEAWVETSRFFVVEDTFPFTSNIGQLGLSPSGRSSSARRNG